MTMMMMILVLPGKYFSLRSLILLLLLTGFVQTETGTPPFRELPRMMTPRGCLLASLRAGNGMGRDGTGR